jgi:hypothetical protein
MKNTVRLFLLLFLLVAGKSVFAQSGFYAIDTIQDIQITFTQPDWDYELDTAKAGSDGYILAAQVVINGTVFDSVGVRYKGNSSYDSTRVKNPLHISLDYVHGNASYQGYQDVKLSNEYSDPSMVREVLAYKILRNYMDAPLCNFARVTINGTYYGVFTSSESIGSDFLSNHFYSSGNSFFKCNPASVLNGHFPNLIYLGTDSANYYDRYEMKSSEKWKDIIDLCDTLNNYSSHVDSILDIDRALWMLAFNNVCVNLDSYSGAFAQNYYLYRDDNARFVPVIWDLNMCFGGFTNTGSGNLNIAGMQQMTPMLHSTNGARPLIMKLLADPTYQKMYIAHMRTINSEMFADSSYQSVAQGLQTLIDSSVQAEIYPLYTYTQFQQGLTTNISTVPGVFTLMDERSVYLNSTTQFQQTLPAIGVYAVSPATPNLLDTVWFTCTVTNAGTVMLGYRDQLADRFRRKTMYDDGLHHDGVAGDNVYGVAIVATSAMMQYYFYAENANAGLFSPERAEHEFYSLQTAVPVAGSGQIVINEFLASNLAGATDEAGQHEDWIELYNNTATPLDLFGLYLTDDFSTPLKFALPDVIVQPYSWIIIWADEDPSTTSYVHCNFKLSSAGEGIMLSTANGTVLDSISFGIQDPDISMGRCPNGTGSFIYFSPPTFDSLNTCPAAVQEQTQASYMIAAYPNPASDAGTIACNDPAAVAVELVSITGAVVQTAYFENDKVVFSLQNLPSGMYFYRAVNSSGMLLHKGKLMVSH